MPSIDSRDISHKWFSNFDEKTMTVTMTYHEEEDAPRIPVKYEVCETCAGKGKTVNPNIDRQGLTREDFDEDPDFAESYFKGHYDVPCNECGGQRVAIVVDEHRATPEQIKEVADWYQEQRNDMITRYYENGGQW